MHHQGQSSCWSISSHFLSHALYSIMGYFYVMLLYPAKDLSRENGVVYVWENILSYINFKESRSDST